MLTQDPDSDLLQRCSERQSWSIDRSLRLVQYFARVLSQEPDHNVMSFLALDPKLCCALTGPGPDLKAFLGLD